MPEFIPEPYSIAFLHALKKIFYTMNKQRYFEMPSRNVNIKSSAKKQSELWVYYFYCVYCVSVHTYVP